MSRVLRERPDELFEISRLNAGTTTPDASFRAKTIRRACRVGHVGNR
jgi:hypothetical protein